MISPANTTGFLNFIKVSFVFSNLMFYIWFADDFDVASSWPVLNSLSLMYGFEILWSPVSMTLLTETTDGDILGPFRI